METYCGTTGEFVSLFELISGYASPEMLACRKYLGVETDVWSLGVILYTLLCGGLPFDDDDEIIMKTKISTGIYEEPEWLSAGKLAFKLLINNRIEVSDTRHTSNRTVGAAEYREYPKTSVVQNAHQRQLAAADS